MHQTAHDRQGRGDGRLILAVVVNVILPARPIQPQVQRESRWPGQVRSRSTRRVLGGVP